MTKKFFYLFVLTVFFLESCNTKKKNDYKDILEKDYFRNHAADSLKYLLPTLDSIFYSDQKYRKNNDAKIFSKHSKDVKIFDSINLKKISIIVDKYGILGIEDIGFAGHAAIFMALQHSDLTTHVKYLDAVEKVFINKKVLPSEYAMYKDRIAVGSGKMQTYGTQLQSDVHGKYELLPVIDVDSIDQRRVSIGMAESIAVYLKRFGINWNIEQYKKDLPALKEKYKLQ